MLILDVNTFLFMSAKVSCYVINQFLSSSINLWEIIEPRLAKTGLKDLYHFQGCLHISMYSRASLQWTPTGPGLSVRWCGVRSFAILVYHTNFGVNWMNSWAARAASAKHKCYGSGIYAVHHNHNPGIYQIRWGSEVVIHSKKYNHRETKFMHYMKPVLTWRSRIDP